MNKKISLTKVLALGATSTALLSGAMMMNNNKVEASSSSIVLLKFKHNAYRYDKNGKRIGRGYITKGSTYYSKGAYRIHGKKYHKLDTKGNIYIKDGNLLTRRLTNQVTLKHNAYLFACLVESGPDVAYQLLLGSGKVEVVRDVTVGKLA